jgi:hypothetical protein
MKQLAIPTLFVTTLLSGCAGDSLMPQSIDRFAVTSEPSGATVYAMGNVAGTTPLELSTSQVFPVTYPYELQSKYGKIELSYPGCEPYSRTVSNSVLANGLKAKLDCPQPAVPAAVTAPAPTMDIEARLRKLKELFDKGLVTEEEYNSKRQAILQEL